MLHTNTRDCGFAGHDWVQELGAEVVEVMDTGLDPVRIVAASPDPKIIEKGGLGGRNVIVASEYEQLARRWIESKGVKHQFFRAYGATESLPPEDCDIIVDNAATGATLKANNLEVFDTILHSTTRLYASKEAWANPAKRARIEKLALLLKSVLDARKRLMLTFNCPSDKLEEMLAFLPALKAPTVSKLHADNGYAIQIAAEATAVPSLVPKIKALGGSDIVVTAMRMLIA
jgi:ATP phosphoribosyltransferase